MDAAHFPRGRVSRKDAAERAARRAKRSNSAATVLDLPIPGSPEISTTWPSPCAACSHRRDSAPISPVPSHEWGLPRMHGLERFGVELARMTSYADISLGESLYLELAHVPELEQVAEKFARARGVSITTASTCASACIRAARFGVSPTTLCSCAAPSPIVSPTTTSPVRNPKARCEPDATAGLKKANSGAQFEASSHRGLHIIFVCSRPAEISEHAVTHVFRDVAVPTCDRLRAVSPVAVEELGKHPRDRARSTFASTQRDRRTGR